MVVGPDGHKASARRPRCQHEVHVINIPVLIRMRRGPGPAARSPPSVPGIVRTVPFSTAGDLGGLLERERELRMLRAGLSRACTGDGALLLIEGPPGVGKTALIRGARAQAEQAGMLALEATGSELEQPFAFGVLRQLLEPVIRQPPGHTDLFAGGPALRPACSSPTNTCRPAPT